MSKHTITKNLNDTYSVKFFNGRYYKAWSNPITQKVLIFNDPDIAEYWSSLPENYPIDWSEVSGIINYYV